MMHEKIMRQSLERDWRTLAHSDAKPAICASAPVAPVSYRPANWSGADRAGGQRMPFRGPWLRIPTRGRRLACSGSPYRMAATGDGSKPRS